MPPLFSPKKLLALAFPNTQVFSLSLLYQDSPFWWSHPVHGFKYHLHFEKSQIPISSSDLSLACNNQQLTQKSTLGMSNANLTGPQIELMFLRSANAHSIIPISQDKISYFSLLFISRPTSNLSGKSSGFTFKTFPHR